MSPTRNRRNCVDVTGDMKQLDASSLFVFPHGFSPLPSVYDSKGNRFLEQNRGRKTLDCQKTLLQSSFVSVCVFAIDCRISYRSEVQDQEGGGVAEHRWHYWILSHLSLDAQRQWTPLFEGIYDGRHDIIFRNILILRFTIIIVALHSGRDIKKRDGRSSFVQRGLSSRIGTSQCFREDKHNRLQNAIIL